MNEHTMDENIDTGEGSGPAPSAEPARAGLTYEEAKRVAQLIDPQGGEFGCWRRRGHVPTSGCGFVSIAGQPVKLYRAVLMFLDYHIPASCRLIPTCGNGWCINPDHRRAIILDPTVETRSFELVPREDLPGERTQGGER